MKHLSASDDPDGGGSRQAVKPDGCQGARGGGLIITLIIGGVFLALFGDRLLKLSDDLRRYRPDGPRLSATSDDKSLLHFGSDTK